VYGDVHGDGEIDRRPLARQVLQECLEPGTSVVRGVFPIEVGRELVRDLGWVPKGHPLAARVDEEIERIDRVDVDRQLDQQIQKGDTLPGAKGETRDVVVRGVSLPVHHAFRLDAQRVRLDLGFCVRRGSQAHIVRAERRRMAVGVTASMSKKQTQGNSAAKDSLSV
jgi:hypothetical protein